MRISLLFGPAICLCVNLLIGCSTVPSTAIAPRTAQDITASCYVYGRFQQVDPSPWYLQNVFGNQMAVVVVLKEVSTGASYQIRFQNTDPVAAIVVKPGAYTIAEVLFARRTRILEVRPISPAMTFVISSGQGWYLGDWLAKASSQTYGYGGTTLSGWTPTVPVHDEEQWDLMPVQDNYSATTREFLSLYPHLQGLKVFPAQSGGASTIPGSAPAQGRRGK